MSENDRTNEIVRYFVIGLFWIVVEACEVPSLGSGVPANIISEADPTITQKIIDSISANNIRENLRQYTWFTHLAGTKGDEILAKQLQNTWKRQGLDHVSVSKYDVLLSYPNKSDANSIFVNDSTGKTVFRSQAKEKDLHPSMDKPDVVPPYNAYSPPGNIQGDLVFVNYGTLKDWHYILNTAGINVTGKIVLCKYGRAFRADLLKIAQENSAGGIIFYTDPADFNLAGDQRVYPEAWWLPPSGVHRGTVRNGNGDPLTPGYPSLRGAYRWAEKDRDLPKILGHPIGYGDAEHLLKRLGGPVAPKSWQGGINVTYRLGPGFFNKDEILHMHITTHNQRVNTSNIFGYIKGSVEPDRYVLMGNHRDAWMFGAVDPTSGTAVMMEVSRVLADLVKQGWRPKRTIVFCSWGAEEFGLVGSYEWIEEHYKILSQRAVAYLNLDSAIHGNFSIKAKGVPLLHEAMLNVAKKIETPNEKGKTLYDEWLENYHKKDPQGNEIPKVLHVGSGSDFAGLIDTAGVPALDVRYNFNPKWHLLNYPLYHSAYETFHAVDKYIDVGFKCSQAIARYYGEMIRYLADSLILPLNTTTYSQAVGEYIGDLKHRYEALMNKHGISLGNLDAAAEEFTEATKNFENRRLTLNTNNPLETRAFNDQLMLLERAFLDPAGTPTKPLSKHLLFAPSSRNTYAGSTFPGLVDLMADPEDKINWEEVKKHLSVISFTIHSAADSLTSSDANSFEI